MGDSAWSIFNDKKIEIKAPQQYLSFKDLQLVEGFKLALTKQDKEALEKILYENGLDVKEGYNVTQCLHRPRTSKEPYDGFRVDAKERTDKAWIMSGSASDEAFFFNTSPELQEELTLLDPHKSLNKKGWMEDRELSIDYNLDSDDDFYDELEESCDEETNAV